MIRFKNIILAIFIITTFSLPVFSKSDPFNCSEMSICPSLEKVNGPISSFFSKVTGMNFMLSSIL